MKSLRLKAIANFIDFHDAVIDVGCDHGLLSIYLVEHQKCFKILASDINQNALNNAINNIKRKHLEAKIPTIISDGLNSINTKSFNTLILSGMGTATILKILSNKSKLLSINKIIIQSNNNLFELRNGLLKIGYLIEDELIVRENNIDYIIIKFIKGKTIYTSLELEFGPILINKKSSVDYYKRQYHKYLEIKNKLPKENLEIVNRIKNLKKIINNLEK